MLENFVGQLGSIRQQELDDLALEEISAPETSGRQNKEDPTLKEELGFFLSRRFLETL